MSLLQLTRVQVGQVGVVPSSVKMLSTDSLATITAAGYLNNFGSILESVQLAPSDLIECLYLYNESTGSGTFGWFQPSISSGVVTLVGQSEGDVVLPTQADHFVYATDTAGTLSTADGASVTHNGTILAYKDNATSFRLKGPSSPNDPSAGADVQSYSGMFYNDSYSDFGVLKTRASFGANVEMDLVLQAPRGLLLIAHDGTQTDGVLKAASQTNIQFFPRSSASVTTTHYSYFDKAGSTTVDNTNDVTLNTSLGHLYFQYGATTQVIVLPTIASASLAGAVAGALFYDTSTNKLMFYNGSALETVTSST